MDANNSVEYIMVPAEIVQAIKSPTGANFQPFKDWMKQTQATHISFRNAQLGKNAIELSSIMTEYDWLTSIDFSNNALKEHAPKVAYHLKSCRGLTTIDLSSNDLTFHAVRVTKQLSHSRTLTTLNLSDNNLGWHANEASLNISRSTTLEVVMLAQNSIAQHGKKTAEHLVKSKTLTTVDFSNNGIETHSGATLREFCQSASIELVQFTNNITKKYGDQIVGYLIQTGKLSPDTNRFQKQRGTSPITSKILAEYQEQQTQLRRQQAIKKECLPILAIESLTISFRQPLTPIPENDARTPADAVIISSAARKFRGNPKGF